MADAYSLVGFQNHLRYGEQARVLRLIPGLERADFSSMVKSIATRISARHTAQRDHADAHPAKRILCRTDHRGGRLC